MKKYSPLAILIVFALFACHSKKTGTPQPGTSTADKVVALSKQKTWTGYYSEYSHYLTPPVDYYRNIVDTAFVIVKVNDTTLSVPNIFRYRSYPDTGKVNTVHYTQTDSARAFVTYTGGGFDLTLEYFYLTDSLSMHGLTYYGGEGYIEATGFLGTNH